MVMGNKRGLFLTNVLSKVFERVLNLVTSEEVRMSEAGMECLKVLRRS